VYVSQCSLHLTNHSFKKIEYKVDLSCTQVMLCSLMDKLKEEDLRSGHPLMSHGPNLSSASGESEFVVQ
jgi:hypothetical protein